MQPFQQRVVDEKAELDAKLTKLQAFIGGEIYNDLPPEEKGLLIHQRLLMQGYSQVLGERIARWTLTIMVLALTTLAATAGSNPILERQAREAAYWQSPQGQQVLQQRQQEQARETARAAAEGAAQQAAMQSNYARLRAVQAQAAQADAAARAYRAANPWCVDKTWRGYRNSIAQLEPLIAKNQQELASLKADNTARREQLRLWIRNETAALETARSNKLAFEQEWKAKNLAAK